MAAITAGPLPHLISHSCKSYLHLCSPVVFLAQETHCKLLSLALLWNRPAPELIASVNVLNVGLNEGFLHTAVKNITKSGSWKLKIVIESIQKRATILVKRLENVL